MHPGHDLPWYFGLHFANRRATWCPATTASGVIPYVGLPSVTVVEVEFRALVSTLLTDSSRATW